MQTERQPEFQEELRSLINRYSAENESDTPDFLLAQFLSDCLAAWNKTARAREEWYGRAPGLGLVGKREKMTPNPDPDNIDPSPRKPVIT